MKIVVAEAIAVDAEVVVTEAETAVAIPATTVAKIVGSSQVKNQKREKAIEHRFWLFPFFDIAGYRQLVYLAVKVSELYDDLVDQ